MYSSPPWPTTPLACEPAARDATPPGTASTSCERCEIVLKHASDVWPQGVVHTRKGVLQGMVVCSDGTAAQSQACYKSQLVVTVVTGSDVPHA